MVCWMGFHSPYLMLRASFVEVVLAQSDFRLLRNSCSSSQRFEISNVRTFGFLPGESSAA